MKIGILCIGDELLKGAVINTNLAFMGQKLLEHGMIPELAMEVPDQPEAVTSALELLMKQTDLVITSGGLGPTADDLTKTALADFLRIPLEASEPVKHAILERLNLPSDLPVLPSYVVSQMLVPRGAEILRNSNGTAPGLFLRLTRENGLPGKKLLLLPGPPSELQPMFEHQALPLIQGLCDNRIYSRLFHLAGVPESVAEEKMQDTIHALPELSVAYCAAPAFLKLFLRSESEDALKKAGEDVLRIFGKAILDDASKTLADEVVHLLIAGNHSLALAESCTGGLISAMITDVPGASAVYPGGITSYANEVKMELLNVSEQTLKQFGAVSRPCAEEMVRGVCRKLHTECGIAVTGIAGPGGGTPEKPVGLVFIGVKYLDRIEVAEYHFHGSRESIRCRTAATALNTLRHFILELN